ncbi:hypothetical protein [Empedobacter brevis]|uniref:hypothetical protein n=1 Tax=Empedobacter brevis TaxID=247 RepID=UPI0028D36BE3|nr:hypothetical protein [Empedobacter brevis]
MKTLVNIYNPTTGNEVITLNELKERISFRRKTALNPLSKKSVEATITVMTTNKNLLQVAAHYKSFEIKQFNAEKAISVFNQGGCQIATIIK